MDEEKSIAGKKGNMVKRLLHAKLENFELVRLPYQVEASLLSLFRHLPPSKKAQAKADFLRLTSERS
jgi:hypothetical protein